jgi:hypothetical protein
MHILTSVYGCPLIVIPQTAEQATKFLSVKGAREISADVFKSNKENLSQEAASHDQGMRVNEFVETCECWRFVNTKIIKSR